MKVRILKIFAISLFFQWLLVQLLKNNPDFVERYYSNGLYPVIAHFFRVLFGWIPFSMGDFLIPILLVLIIIYLVRVIRKRAIFQILYTLLGLVGLLYFIFHFCWGLNYYRTPVATKFHVSTQDFSEKKLLDYTTYLVEELNEIHLNITSNDSLQIVPTLRRKEIQDEMVLSYQNFGKKNPSINYTSPSIKSSLYSVPQLFLGFSGYFNPFTGEAQVNYKIPLATYPVNVSHEMAHQLGIAFENEANFIGILIATNSQNEYIRYTGYLRAYFYCLNDLYRSSKSVKQLPSLNVGIQKEIAFLKAFGKSYRHWSKKYAKKTYDSYLKINNQKEGIKSYNKVVDLLVNYGSLYQP